MSGLEGYDVSRVSLGYDAVDSSGKRRGQSTSTNAECAVLTPAKRKKSNATTMDDTRNSALLSWMIRKHVDHVADFTPHVTGIPERTAQELKGLLDWHGRKENFDVAKRHSRRDMLRLFETGKILQGDAALVHLNSNRVQLIEGDRIVKTTDLEGRKPMSAARKKRIEADFAANGLRLDYSTGEVLQYLIANRGTSGKGLYFDHIEDAENVNYDGYFFRADQYRGVSPILAALNQHADLRESQEYTLLKIKLMALFGMVIHRNEGDHADFDDDGTDSAEDATTATNADSTLNMKGGAPQILDLDEAHKATEFESKTPAPSVKEYQREMTRVVLLALDIPFTMYDSMQSSFSARIADRVEYDQSARAKQDKNGSVLRNYSDWIIGQWWNVPDGSIAELKRIAESEGVSLRQLRNAVQWVPGGSPWLDRSKEVSADALAVATGLDSPQRIIAKRYGTTDWKQFVSERAEFYDFAEGLGQPIMIGQPGQSSIGEVAQGEADDEPAGGGDDD